MVDYPVSEIMARSCSEDDCDNPVDSTRAGDVFGKCAEHLWEEMRAELKSEGRLPAV